MRSDSTLFLIASDCNRLGRFPAHRSPLPTTVEPENAQLDSESLAGAASQEGFLTFDSDDCAIDASHMGQRPLRVRLHIGVVANVWTCRSDSHVAGIGRFARHFDP